MAGDGAKSFFLTQRSRRRLQSQIENGGATNVVIVVSTADSRGRSKIQVLKGHKALLASWSPVLKTAFADAETCGHPGWIQLSQVDFVALKALVDAFYKAEMTLDFRSVWAMRRVAQRLDIDAVVNLCTGFVTDSVNADNCVQFLIEARKCGSSELEAAAREVVVSSFQTIRNGNEHLALDCDLYLSVLEEARVRHGLSELSVLTCALQWVEYDQGGRREVCPAMLSRLRLQPAGGEADVHAHNAEDPMPGIVRAVSLTVSEQAWAADCVDQEEGFQDAVSSGLPPVDSLFGLEGSAESIEAVKRMMNAVNDGNMDLVFPGGIKTGSDGTGEGLYSGCIKAVSDLGGGEFAVGREPGSCSGSGTIESDAFSPTWRSGPASEEAVSEASEDVPECVAPYARGILSNVGIGDLKELGWRVVYGKPCVQDTSAEDLERLPGDYLLVGVALKGESTLRLAAMGRRDRILTRTRPGETNSVNGAYWHLEPGHSFGFSACPSLPTGDGGTTVEVRGKRMAWRLEKGESTLMGFTSPRAEWSAENRGRSDDCVRKWLKLVFSWQDSVCSHSVARTSSRPFAPGDIPSGE